MITDKVQTQYITYSDWLLNVSGNESLSDDYLLVLLMLAPVGVHLYSSRGIFLAPFDFLFLFFGFISAPSGHSTSRRRAVGNVGRNYR